MNHAYFSSGVSSFVQSIFATHPPLDVRIKRIDPNWDGDFAPVTREVSENERTSRQPEQASKSGVMKTAAASAVIASQILESVGQVSPEQLDYAISLVNDIPPAIRDAVHDPYSARAIIYCLVIDDKQESIRDKQIHRLREMGDTGIFDLVDKLLGTVKALDIRYRMPLIDMTLPSLRLLSKEQYLLFKKNLLFLIQADNRIDMFEWSLQKILFHHLDPVFDRPGKKITKFRSYKVVKKHIDVLISMLVYACVRDKAEIKAAFANAERELGQKYLVLLSRQQINIKNLDLAVENLALLKPLLKPRLLKACLIVITQDQKYSPDEMELIRAIGDVLDCPVPPYLG